MKSTDFVITDDPSMIPYQELTYSIADGQSVDVFAVFKYFRVISQSGGALSVRFGQNGMVTPFTGQGIGLNIGLFYPRLTLYNTGDSAMAITIALAIGDINDDRLNISTALSSKDVGTVLTTLNNFATSTTAAICAPADANQKEVIITNLEAAGGIVIYLGGSTVNNTTNKGTPLNPGQTMVFNTTAAIYAVSASGTPSLGRTTNDYV